MTRYQLVLLPTLATAIFVLGGALKQRAASGQPADRPVSAASDPQACAVLDRAIAALAPDRVMWMETLVWQQVRCEDFAYQARGRLVTGPERMRLDLNVQVGKTLGELRVVNDGTTLWQSTRIGGEDLPMRRSDLPVADDTMKTPSELAQARAEFLRVRGFAGLGAMLNGIRQQMHGIQLRQEVWQNRPVHLISGDWHEQTGAAPLTLENSPPRFHLRQCRVYVDADSLWPHRIEWWGAEKPRDASELLMQTEFRDPILNRAMSPERSAAEFTMSVN